MLKFIHFNIDPVNNRKIFIISVYVIECKENVYIFSRLHIIVILATANKQ